MYLIRRIGLSLLFFLSIVVSMWSQVYISSHLPESGRGGEFIKRHKGPNSVQIAPPYGQNMHQTYFYVCIQNLQVGPLHIKLEYESLNKVPKFAAYKIDEGEWQLTEKIDTSDYVIDIPEGTKRCYFASGIPFTYADVREYVANLPEDIAMPINLGAKSLEGREVPLIRITDPAIPDTYKQLVWILGGQHPFELPGLHTVRHMMDFLVSDDPIARELRQKSIFYVCPLVDVDASDNGLSGKKKLGRGTPAYPVQDLNWDWNVMLNSNNSIRNTQGGPNAYDNISHPQVFALQQLIYTTARNNPLRIFLDSHSPFPEDCAGSDTCAFHFVDKYLLGSKRSYHTRGSHIRKFWDQYETYMQFRPVCLSDASPEGNSNSSSNSRKVHSRSYGPGDQFDYERSADYWVDSENALYYRNTLSHTNIFFSTTIETGWFETPGANREDALYKFWDKETLKAHGAALVKSIHHLMNDFTVAAENDQIIDLKKDRKKFKWSGEWEEITQQIPNTLTHFHEGIALSTQKTGSKFTIPLEVTASGVYDLYTWFNPVVRPPFDALPNLNVSDPSAQFTIFDGKETTHIFVDQTRDGGYWYKLTTLYLDPGNGPMYIEIAKTSKNQKYVIADAIRIAPSFGMATEATTLNPFNVEESNE